MKPRFTSSLLQKKALDALLDSMADGLDGHDNYDELGAHRRGEEYIPEAKGTEAESNHQPPVVIPAADLPQAPDLQTAEFFKEGEPTNPLEEIEEHEFFKEAPQFEMSASGMRRVGKDGHSPEWEKIQNILTKYGYMWLGHVSDGTEMWGNKNLHLIYDPATRKFKQTNHGKTDLEGSVQELEAKVKAYTLQKATAVTAALKSCVACECGDCIEHNGLKTASPTCPHCGSSDYGLMPTDFETAKCNGCGKNWNHGIVDGINNPYPKTAGKLTPGTKGEDRNGEYDVLAINGNKITYRYSDGTTNEGDLAIKQRIHDGIMAERARANEPKKIPGYLREDEIEWTPEMAWFLGYLAGPGKARIFAEAPPKYEEAVVNKYHELTGQILEERSGVFNIAPETKWSPELAVMFRPTEEVPDEVARQQQKPGLVNRNQFVWALIRVGFRIGDKPNVELIRSKVPDSMADYFDLGSGVEHKQLKESGEVKSYGMGTPIGGTDNDYEGADDEPEEMNDPGELSLDMTSSYDPDVEDQAFFAALEAEEDEAESRARFWASLVDGDDLEMVKNKFASTEEIGWFAKSARPTPQKIELLQKQFKLTPEQIELCIATDPSPNQSDFVAWIAKFLSKGAFTLPEDTERIKGQLEKFQKFKKSPQFLFSKDLQQYDPAKLYETLEQAEAGGMSSKKEQKRETVRKGADVVVQEGDVTIYKVTAVDAARELGSGTNWCTAMPGSSYAADYLAKGPLYIFFDSGSAVAQLCTKDNMFMNRADVCILESVTGESSRYDRAVKKFLADPGLAKALQLLAAKEPDVKKWAETYVADPEDVKKILGEAATAEVQENAEYETSLADYEKQMKTYEQEMAKYRPKQEKWNKEYDAYQQKQNEYQKKLEDWQAQDPAHGTSENPVPFWLDRDRPKAPKRPDEPRRPYHPSRTYPGGGYSYGEPRGKRFVMQVKNALATGQVLPPEVESQLIDGGVSTDLLLKYGSQFHPGKPWEPLAQAILRDVSAGKADKKQMTDYAVKFLKGRWPEAEPHFLSKMFLLQNNMQNMQRALEYATRVVKGRWPEFEAQIQKAKPGLASGYGAAEYAINAAKMPWYQMPGIKKKKTTGRINAEDCMIKGNPGEARKYAEAFFQGKRWEDFEKSALEADNLNALTNYAANTLHARMPELEAKILEGVKDAQESKGRKRYRKYTDLPLEYAKKVIQGRWPEYEAKMLEHIKSKDVGEYNNTNYEPSGGKAVSSWQRDRYLSSKFTNYIEQVVQGRWPELEAVLLARYQEKPQLWAENQRYVDGYLLAEAAVCKNRTPAAPPTDEENRAMNGPYGAAYSLQDQPMGTRTEQPDKRVQQQFTDDQSCQWPEGEKRLVTRDPGYEAVLLSELKRKADSDMAKSNDKDKGVSLEDLRKMEKVPEGDTDWKQRDTKPNWTIWNGYWIGWYGMDRFEHYTEYMWANKQDWPEGVEILSILEELKDVRGRYMHETRQNWKRTPEQPKAEGATASMKKFTSSLLNRKKALVDMHEAPTMLPPRDDIRRHIDEQEQQIINDGVMEGVNPNQQPTHQPGQIDPRINPDGVVASNKEAATMAITPMQFENWLDRVPDFLSNLHIKPVAGALQIEYKGKELGWLGLPLEKVMDMVGQFIGDQGLNENDNKIWDHILKPYGGQEAVFASKQADYDQMADEEGEYFLDQVRDAENEAKRSFMEDEYMQQLCDDYIPPKTMEQLWQVMKDEYTAEYFGTPYTRVQDFTDQGDDEGSWQGRQVQNDSTGNAGRFASCPLCKSANVKTIEDKGYGNNVVLAECQDCAGFYSISER